MRRLAALACLIPCAAPAQEAAQAIVAEMGIKTFTATRTAKDEYDLKEGYTVMTNLCFEVVSGARVVVTNGKMIFVDTDKVCDVEDIYGE